MLIHGWDNYTPPMSGIGPRLVSSSPPSPLTCTLAELCERTGLPRAKAPAWRPRWRCTVWSRARPTAADHGTGLTDLTPSDSLADAAAHVLPFDGNHRRVRPAYRFTGDPHVHRLSNCRWRNIVPVGSRMPCRPVPPRRSCWPTVPVWPNAAGRRLRCGRTGRRRKQGGAESMGGVTRRWPASAPVRDGFEIVAVLSSGPVERPSPSPSKRGAGGPHAAADMEKRL